MRTTIEITQEQHAALVELAARRAEKGFSRLVQEALDQYLETERAALDKRRRALKLMGSFSDAEVESLRDSVAEVRARWR